ncbi:MAG: hypothetical protein DMF90_04620 [Acidobacteria bacterium]|nr:MAG: hypothetical protein DMF90_04620 [Acidobacteriota bacterium]
MRLSLAVIVMLGLPAMAAAQPAAAVAGGVPRLPPIGLPLPQIGLPLPRIGLPAADALRPRDGVSHPRAGRQHRPVIYFVPIYGWPYLYEAPERAGGLDESATSRERPSLIGRLRLDVEPGGGDQQVYVDGYYVGTLADFNGELDLEVGPHTVEIRAPGYETLHVSVNIAPGRAIAYRGMLKASDEKPAPEAVVQNSTPVAHATPMIGYVIPGCYLGNVPPQDARLPPSCDVSRVITIQH